MKKKQVWGVEFLLLVVVICVVWFLRAGREPAVPEAARSVLTLYFNGPDEQYIEADKIWIEEGMANAIAQLGEAGDGAENTQIVSMDQEGNPTDLRFQPYFDGGLENFKTLYTPEQYQMELKQQGCRVAVTDIRMQELSAQDKITTYSFTLKAELTWEDTSKAAEDIEITGSVQMTPEGKVSYIQMPNMWEAFPFQLFGIEGLDQ